MKTSDFDYHLPSGLIAQTPVEPRDSSRLMVLRRDTGEIEHRRFTEITDYLREGDVMVFNDSRVIPARLYGKRLGTGGGVELLLLRQIEPNVWEALVRPAKRLHAGAKVEIEGEGCSTLVEVMAPGKNGTRIIRVPDETQLLASGKVPLPPYIHKSLSSPERYQTVYARVEGSAAAPTAGLHFTRGLLAKIEEKGVRCLFVTLHIGLDTFSPVREEDPGKHVIHREYGVLDQEVGREINNAKDEGRRVICVGTTSVRVVEQAAQLSMPLQPFEGWADLFILPGHRFRCVDVMVTNFHLPRSALLMLVSAFAGKQLINQAYQEAINNRYRFYSFGDAMLII